MVKKFTAFAEGSGFRAFMIAIAISLSFNEEAFTFQFQFGNETMLFSGPELQVETPVASHPSESNTFASVAVTDVYPGGYTTGFYRTTNGGTSWTGTNAIRNLSGAIISTVGNPQIAITHDSKYIVSYIAGAGTGTAFKVGVTFSTNNGQNWASTYLIPGSDTADKPTLAVDNTTGSPYFGRCYIAYNERGGVYFTHSTNSGVTWTTARKISPPLRQSRTGAHVTTGPNGEVYVSWPYIQNNIDYIGFAASFDGGVTWDSTDTAIQTSASASAFRINLNQVKLHGLPVISVDKSNTQTRGRIYISYIERKTGISPALDTCDLTVHYSTNHGTSWSTKVRANSSALNQKSFQLFQSLNVDPNGGVNLIYYDTRSYAANDSFSVYVSRSTNGGQTFAETPASSHKFKLKQLPSNKRLFGIPSYIGTCIGIASSPSRLLAVWYDNTDEQYRAYSSSMLLGGSISLTVKAANKGLYNPLSNSLSRRDSAKVYLRSSVHPYHRIDSAIARFDSLTLCLNLSFANAAQGSRYIELVHKGSINLWSSSPVSISAGSANQYDFTSNVSHAYGNNQALIDQSPLTYAAYSGDVNMDGSVDVADVVTVENDALNFTTGNVLTDLNGDNFVDVTDVLITDEASAGFVSVLTP